MRVLRLIPAVLLIAVAITAIPPRASATTESLDYVVLGDSLTMYYPPRYEQLVQSGFGVDVDPTFLGVGGASSADLRHALETDPAFRSAVAAADIITWNIGINDLLGARWLYLMGQCGGADDQDCMRANVAALKDNWDAIVAEIGALTEGNFVAIRTMDIYYSTGELDAPSGLDDILRPYWEEANGHIAESGEQNGIPVAQVYEAFNGADGTSDPYAEGYVGSDYVHLTAQGSDAIAELLFGLGSVIVGPDTDGDTIIDQIDNCLDVPNPDQANADADDIDLSAYGKPFDDATRVNSDDVGDACDDDADNDGLTNDAEAALPGSACPSASAPLDPLNLDSDADGVVDRAECVLGSDPAVKTSVPAPIVYGTDLDRDGLDNGVELAIGTNPYAPDTDLDKVNDGIEFKWLGSDPLSDDSDGDGCEDRRETASVNGDRVVNVLDMSEIVRLTGTSRISPRYIPTFDVMRDGSINVLDLYFALRQTGMCA